MPLQCAQEPFECLQYGNSYITSRALAGTPKKWVNVLQGEDLCKGFVPDNFKFWAEDVRIVGITPLPWSPPSAYALWENIRGGPGEKLVTEKDKKRGNNMGKHTKQHREIINVIWRGTEVGIAVDVGVDGKCFQWIMWSNSIKWLPIPNNETYHGDNAFCQMKNPLESGLLESLDGRCAEMAEFFIGAIMKELLYLCDTDPKALVEFPAVCQYYSPDMFSVFSDAGMGFPSWTTYANPPGSNWDGYEDDSEYMPNLNVVQKAVGLLRDQLLSSKAASKSIFKKILCAYVPKILFKWGVLGNWLMAGKSTPFSAHGGVSHLDNSLKEATGCMGLPVRPFQYLFVFGFNIGKIAPIDYDGGSICIVFTLNLYDNKLEPSTFVVRFKPQLFIGLPGVKQMVTALGPKMVLAAKITVWMSIGFSLHNKLWLKPGQNSKKGFEKSIWLDPNVLPQGIPAKLGKIRAKDLLGLFFYCGTHAKLSYFGVQGKDCIRFLQMNFYMNVKVEMTLEELVSLRNGDYSSWIKGGGKPLGGKGPGKGSGIHTTQSPSKGAKTVNRKKTVPKSKKSAKQFKKGLERLFLAKSLGWPVGTPCKQGCIGKTKNGKCYGANGKVTQVGKKLAAMKNFEPVTKVLGAFKKASNALNGAFEMGGFEFFFELWIGIAVSVNQPKGTNPVPNFEDDIYDEPAFPYRDPYELDETHALLLEEVEVFDERVFTGDESVLDGLSRAELDAMLLATEEYTPPFVEPAKHAGEMFNTGVDPDIDPVSQVSMFKAFLSCKIASLIYGNIIVVIPASAWTNGIIDDIQLEIGSFYLFIRLAVWPMALAFYATILKGGGQCTGEQLNTKNAVSWLMMFALEPVRVVLKIIGIDTQLIPDKVNAVSSQIHQNTKKCPDDDPSTKNPQCNLAHLAFPQISAGMEKSGYFLLAGSPPPIFGRYMQGDGITIGFGARFSIYWIPVFIFTILFDTKITVVWNSALSLVQTTADSGKTDIQLTLCIGLGSPADPSLNCDLGELLEFILQLLGFLLELIEAFLNFLKDVGEFIAYAMELLVKAIAEAFEAAFEAIAELVTMIADAINEWLVKCFGSPKSRRRTWCEKRSQDEEDNMKIIAIAGSSLAWLYGGGSRKFKSYTRRRHVDATACCNDPDLFRNNCHDDYDYGLTPHPTRGGNDLGMTPYYFCRVPGPLCVIRPNRRRRDRRRCWPYDRRCLDGTDCTKCCAYVGLSWNDPYSIRTDAWEFKFGDFWSHCGPRRRRRRCWHDNRRCLLGFECQFDCCDGWEYKFEWWGEKCGPRRRRRRCWTEGRKSDLFMPFLCCYGIKGGLFDGGPKCSDARRRRTRRRRRRSRRRRQQRGRG
jgi:hypothetical protein